MQEIPSRKLIYGLVIAWAAVTVVSLCLGGMGGYSHGRSAGYNAGQAAGYQDGKTLASHDDPPAVRAESKVEVEDEPAPVKRRESAAGAERSIGTGTPASAVRKLLGTPNEMDRRDTGSSGENYRPVWIYGSEHGDVEIFIAGYEESSVVWQWKGDLAGLLDGSNARVYGNVFDRLEAEMVGKSSTNDPYAGIGTPVEDVPLNPWEDRRGTGD